MRSNYKMLGNYIREVNVRNTELKDLELLGVSIQKEFIPSIANIIGTDMSKYKIVKKNQFAYGTVTSRNGDKISIALLKDYDEVLISQAYISFEVIDENELLPEYLMMWFRRREFDRYSRYMSIGSAREVFSWEEMCNVMLPVPSIEKQRKIVEDYNRVLKRIQLNDNLIIKLENIAESIYKQWFVDFEFPYKNTKSYKSNGGIMKKTELGEIPQTWNIKTYGEVMDFKTGKLNSNAAVENGLYKFFTCSQETYRTNTFSFNTEAVLLGGNNASAIYPLKYYIGKFDAYQRTYVITSKSDNLSNKQIYFEIKNKLNHFKGESSGTTTKFLTTKLLNPLKIILPTKDICDEFNKKIGVIFKVILDKNEENEKLRNLLEIVLSKITIMGE